MSQFEKITVPNDHKPHPNEMFEQVGVVTLNQFLPHKILDEYVRERETLLGGTPKWLPGWNDAVPYLRVASMRQVALYRPLTEFLANILGNEAGLHLCLTGFQSTERAWHQDRYLNPENVGENYIAVWIALDDISEESGPFEFIPGSHKWPVIERKKVWDGMRERGQNPDLPTWPSDSQGWVGEACEEEIAKRGAQSVRFLPKKGDVLIWHASLIHRGSKPTNPNIERRALICHYSEINSRPDMPNLKREKNGSYFFDFEHGYTEPEKSTHK